MDGCWILVVPSICSQIKKGSMSLNKIESGCVLLDNNKSCKVMGIGNIYLKLIDGCQRIIESVRYVLDHKRNLVSVGMLDNNGLNLRIEKGVMKVLKGSKVIMKGIKRNSIYILEEDAVIGSIYLIRKK